MMNCSHQIAKRLSEFSVLLLIDFHPLWNFRERFGLEHGAVDIVIVRLVLVVSDAKRRNGLPLNEIS
jgi:hypothetical protein